MTLPNWNAMVFSGLVWDAHHWMDGLWICSNTSHIREIDKWSVNDIGPFVRQMWICFSHKSRARVMIIGFSDQLLSLFWAIKNMASYLTINCFNVSFGINGDMFIKVNWVFPLSGRECCSGRGGLVYTVEDHHSNVWFNWVSSDTKPQLPTYMYKHRLSYHPALSSPACSAVSIRLAT